MTNVNDPNDPAAIDPRLARNALQADPMLQEGRRGTGSTLIIVSFLAVVVAITAVAIASHHQEPGQASIQAPPGAPGSNSPPVTTGAATPMTPAMPSGRNDSAVAPGAPNLTTRQVTPPPSTPANPNGGMQR